MRPASTPNPLPRAIAPGVFWIGKCNVLAEADGRDMHSYNSAYLVVGEDRSAVIDTGMTGQTAFVEQLERLIDRPGVSAPSLAFSTHAEMAHVGGLGWLMERFPALQAHGDVSDLHLVWPEHADRLSFADPGARFDLGGREIVVVESVFRDLVHSRWFFDTGSGTLFPADGFAVAHYHQDGACGCFVEDVADLNIEDGLAEFAMSAFYWTRFVDLRPFAARLQALILDELDVKLIAPAHGLPLRDPAATLPRVCAGLCRMREEGGLIGTGVLDRASSGRGIPLTG